MVVLVVIGTLAALLAVACWWEAHTGRPQWGSRGLDTDPQARTALARARTVGAVAAVVVVSEAGGDGGG